MKFVKIRPAFFTFPASAFAAFVLVAPLLSSCSKQQAASPRSQIRQQPANKTTATFAEFASASVRKAAQTYPPVALELEPPLSLTSSDGTGLELANMSARAIIDGPLAFTELRLRFKNPQSRVLEGRFSITLPEGAAISRLAMSIDGRWQEAEVVERELAHRAYEDFLHRRQDPALLEKEAGNQFRARIFPIPANSTKDIIVSYSHVLRRGDDVYRIPLRGLPAIASLNLKAVVRQANGEKRTFSLERTHYTPTTDFEASIAGTGNGLRSGRHLAIRIAPSIRTTAEAINELTVLFDTSASRAAGFASSVEKLGQLVGSLRATHGDSLKLTVAVFDQRPELIFSGPAKDFGDRELAAIRARRPLGASDFGRALDWLAARQPHGRLVVISDGISTQGRTEIGSLRQSLAKLEGLERMDAVVVGGIRDRELMSAMVTGNFKRDGIIVDGELPSRLLADRISRATRSHIRIAVEGASWTWPQTVDGIQAGDQVVVFVEMGERNESAKSSVTVRLSGGLEQQITVATTPALAPLLSRSIAAAEIARLEAQRTEIETKQTGHRQRLKDQIVRISTEHRVLSRFTALLVLETEDDYRRYNIKRSALAQIMTIGELGIEWLTRDLVIAAPLNPTLLHDKKFIPTKNDQKTQSAEARNRLTEKREISAGSSPTNVSHCSAQDPLCSLGDGDDDVVGVKDEIQLSPRDLRRPAPRSQGNAVMPEEVDAEEEHINDRHFATNAGQEPPSSNVASDEFAANLRNSPPAYTGRMAELMAQIERGSIDTAIASALTWRNDNPGDVMALIALGSALERSGNFALAARAYGSIIDLFPSRADLRRFAGSRLQRLDGQADLAVDSFEKAVAARPDHLTGHRQLAYSLVRVSRFSEAFEVLETAFERSFPREPTGGRRILAADLTLVGAAWVRVEPARRSEIEVRLAGKQLKIATEPSLRFVLNWETDANDVDFHIFDGEGGHAFYQSMQLASGGELYADVTNGYGPECFAIEGSPRAFPYRLQIHYYSRGPMGYGMGQVEIIHHDGHGMLSFDERPFVVMNDNAYLDLGTVVPLLASQQIAMPSP